MRKLFTRLGIVNGIVLLLIVILFLVDRTALIITFGFRMTQTLLILGFVVAIILFITGNGAVILATKKHLKGPAGAAKKKDMNRPFLSAEERQDPVNVREDLEILMDTRARVREVFAEGLNQMDSIDRKQEKLAEILQRSEAGTLAEVTKTIDEAETALCRNLTKVINRGILWDDSEALEREKTVIYEEHREAMHRCLSQNRNILHQCDTLLTETVNYLDESADEGSSGEAGLRAMTEAIKALRAINFME